MGMSDHELERRYGDLLDNPAIREVGHARTPNNAAPVDEDAVLSFVRETEREHAAYVHNVFSKYIQG